jgi:lantibiotic modifying enzyme
MILREKMCGFSHGAAGIRYALGRVLVQGLGPEEEIRRAMHAAVEFEQDSFEPSRSNWRDYRFEETDPRAHSTFSAWCHGAAGIALAEVGLARLGLPIRSERIHALYRLSESSANTRLSLCCGLASCFEVDRLYQTDDRLLHGAEHTAKGEITPSEEQDSPLALFKASYGTSLLRAMTSCIPDLPSVLLLE